MARLKVYFAAVLTVAICIDTMQFRYLIGLAPLLVPWEHAEAKIYDTRFPGTTWDDQNWKITTTNLDEGHYQSRMSLSNGYLGINLAALGPFFEDNSRFSILSRRERHRRALVLSFSTTAEFSLGFRWESSLVEYGNWRALIHGTAGQRKEMLHLRYILS